jgi:hypothetical protein
MDEMNRKKKQTKKRKRKRKNKWIEQAKIK